MKPITQFILILLLTFTVVPVYADNESSVRLLNAKSLKCSFPDGVFTEWNTGQFKTEAAGKMKDIIFDSINSKKQRARMLGSQGSTDVAALSSLGALHFMEMTGSVALLWGQTERPRPGQALSI